MTNYEKITDKGLVEIARGLIATRTESHSKFIDGKYTTSKNTEYVFTPTGDKFDSKAEAVVFATKWLKEEAKEEPKLSPCPFCGSSDIHMYECHTVFYSWFKCKCEECGAQIDSGKDTTEEKAIAHWNMRNQGGEDYE